MSFKSISQLRDVSGFKSATVNIQRLIIVAQLLGTIPPLEQEKQSLNLRDGYEKIYVGTCEKSSNH